MTPITRQDILAHQAIVPWGAQHQVEQDLLLCRAMVALFNDKFLNSQVAMRGGTLLHKVHLAPPARYSEDIDLVVVGTRPAETSDAPFVALTDVLNAESFGLGHVVLAIQHSETLARVAHDLLDAPIIEPNRRWKSSLKRM